MTANPDGESLASLLRWQAAVEMQLANEIDVGVQHPSIKVYREWMARGELIRERLGERLDE